MPAAGRSDDLGPRPRLLLVGAGHAHLEILRRLIVDDPGRFDLTVVSAGDKHHYSGMVPGFLAGMYRESEIAFDLAPLVARAGGRLIVDQAVRVDPERQVVRLRSGAEEGYDLASFNVGSREAGRDTPGVEEHGARIKPIGRAVDLRDRLRALVEEDDGEAAVAVVGGGAAGVEVACAAAAVLDRARRPRRVGIFEAGETLLAGYAERFRRRALAVLRRKGIAVRTRSAVTAVHPGSVELEGGEREPARLAVWLTGPAASPLFQGSGMALDRGGFLLVDPALRSVSDPRVFAVGDCATLAAHPDTPKAGVYAVREGPVLWESLRAAVGGGDPPSYEPQEGFLSILNTADGKALLDWKGVVSHSRWAFWLKDRIDRRFMRRYQSLIGTA